MARQQVPDDFTEMIIASFRGTMLFHCKSCNRKVQVHKLVKGKSVSPYTGEEINWCWLEDAKGHCLEDYSH